MKRIHNLLLFLLMTTVLLSCGEKKEKEQPKFMQKEAVPGLHNKATVFFQPLPESAPNEANPATEAKIKLGHVLYFDNRLSKNNTISCNSCHNLATYGVDNKPTSPGDAGEFGPRNSPTVLNAALHIAQFWDGREPDVEAQAGGPILNPIEMAMPDSGAVMQRLKGIKGYQELFKAAYPDDEDPFTYQNLRYAIGAFERQLLTPSRFDKYLAGDKTALTEAEQKGLQTFIETGCITCHTGPLVGGNMFQKLGLYGSYAELTGAEKDDLGKYEVTGNENDKYIFKVPSLRNVEKTYPYFHDGGVEKLHDAVKIMAKLQLNKELTDEQADAIVTFLKSLTGEVPAQYKEAPEMPM
ncbi:MAG TPA: cytochrome-c peroxidase [Flammeovirgaceae bacterium]|nr:cytochrome-c peroxidase [Flammeovirgaceae bacterium]